MTSEKLTLNVCFPVLICLFLVLALSGCGSSGDNHPDAGAASAYKGNTKQATINEDNLVDLILGGYAGDGFASMIGAMTKREDDSFLAGNTVHPMNDLAQLIIQSIQSLDIPGVAHSSGTPDMAARTSSSDSEGAEGGIAHTTLEIDDSKCTFYGTIEYEDFTSGGVTVNGTADIKGMFDCYQQFIVQMTYVCDKLRFSHSSGAMDLTGTMIWNYQLSSFSENVTLNMVMLEIESGKTYWYNDYKAGRTIDDDGSDQVISGRYYDYDYGYVDLETSSAMFKVAGYVWPIEGVFTCRGKNGTWASMVFDSQSVTLEADFDGDGLADWDSTETTD